MKSLNNSEIEQIAGGFSVLALPLAVIYIPLPKPSPTPAEEPVAQEVGE